MNEMTDCGAGGGCGVDGGGGRRVPVVMQLEEVVVPAAVVGQPLGVVDGVATPVRKGTEKKTVESDAGF